MSSGHTGAAVSHWIPCQRHTRENKRSIRVYRRREGVPETTCIVHRLRALTSVLCCVEPSFFRKPTSTSNSGQNRPADSLSFREQAAAVKTRHAPSEQRKLPSRAKLNSPSTRRYRLQEKDIHEFGNNEFGLFPIRLPLCSNSKRSCNRLRSQCVRRRWKVQGPKNVEGSDK